jgi:signal transduction histidine kinase
MKLRLKLALSFALVVVAGSLATMLAIALVLRSQMQSFVFESDMARARSLAAFLGDYYARSGSFAGAFDALPPRSFDLPAGHGPRPGRGEGMGMMRPNAAEPVRVVFVDSRGAVLFDSSGSPSPPGTASLVLSQGIVVEADGSVAGYVAVGSMIDPALRGLELGFLNSAILAVLVSGLAAAVLAVAVGTALVLQITSPLKALERATGRIAAGDFAHRVAVSRRDEIGELADRFNRMAGALEENELLRRKMVEDAAHELRTPVSLLRANVDMMLEGVYPIDRENLLSLSDEIGRLARLVQELDAQNNADTGAPSLQKTACALAPLIERAVSLHRAPLAEKKIAVRTEIPGDLPPLTADPGKLLQVFSNIVSNAVRHVNEGGRIRVEAARERGKGEVVVGIENTGSSVPAEDLERIFERFYRSDPARTRDAGGSGLGLSISREIVRRHGGRIWAENLLPDGVRFNVALPLSS